MVRGIAFYCAFGFLIAWFAPVVPLMNAVTAGKIIAKKKAALASPSPYPVPSGIASAASPSPGPGDTFPIPPAPTKEP